MHALASLRSQAQQSEREAQQQASKAGRSALGLELELMSMDEVQARQRRQQLAREAVFEIAVGEEWEAQWQAQQETSRQGACTTPLPAPSRTPHLSSGPPINALGRLPRACALVVVALYLRPHSLSPPSLSRSVYFSLLRHAHSYLIAPSAFICADGARGLCSVRPHPRAGGALAGCLAFAIARLVPPRSRSRPSGRLQPQWAVSGAQRLC